MHSFWCEVHNKQVSPPTYLSATFPVLTQLLLFLFEIVLFSSDFSLNVWVAKSFQVTSVVIHDGLSAIGIFCEVLLTKTSKNHSVQPWKLKNLKK